jgi:signal transduction histidine kinase
MSAHFARRLPWLVAGASVTLAIVGIGLSLIYVARTGDGRPLLSHLGLTQISTLLYAGLGGLIVSRHPRNVVGWLILATGVFSALTSIATGYAAFRPLYPATAMPSTAWADWLDRWIWMPASALPILFIFLLFPDGHLPGRGWAPVGWAAAAGLLAVSLALALHPGPLEAWDLAGGNPLGIPGTGAALETTLNLGIALTTAGFAASVLALGARFRRSRGAERERMKWLLYAVGLTVAGAVMAAAAPALVPLSEALSAELGLVATNLGIASIAAAVGIAILRHRLYDINLVINRTLVYGALTGGVAMVYLLVAGGLGVLLQASGSLGLSLLGVGIVALVVQPARDQLQRAVNRLMYGERDDPYAVLSRLGQRLEAALAPEAVLLNIVETVAQTLKLPYAAIALARAGEVQAPGADFPVVAAFGVPAGETLRLPLAYQGEVIGRLLVGPRAGERLSAVDRRLLADLARQAGVAAHAVRLTADLQRSRERLVSAREEERRRLRRDLHDGLGSQLAALHLRADTAVAMIPADPDAAQAVVAELRDEIRAAVADIRRLVYELRPPALDELGLAGALRALAAQCSAPGGLRVAVEAPEALPPLPAAVEVAAYRIAQEALANVVRHAGAARASLRLEVAEALQLDIADDGRGLPADYRAGVGLGSMRERAAELGGSVGVSNRPTGGAQVVVRLPLARAD